MKSRFLVMVLLTCLLLAGCEQIAWFGSGAVTDAALQAQARKDVIQNLMNDPNMMQIIAQAAGSGIIKETDQQLILSAIATYQELHGTSAIIKENAKDPAWWIAFAMGLIAAYQKKQRMNETKKTK